METASGGQNTRDNLVTSDKEKRKNLHMLCSGTVQSFAFFNKDKMMLSSFL
jgi:hypothetical protein